MMHISELETPALLIDLDVMERNLVRVAAYAREHGLRLRPHTKTHKTPALGKRQVELGAAGLTVAKVGEAEVMAQAGGPGLLVAYPIIGASKLARLAAVARNMPVTVSLDSEEAARQLSEAGSRHGVSFGVLVEVDLGFGRVGVDPLAAALSLIRFVRAQPCLSWEGIAFYPGHIKLLDEAGMATLRHVTDLLSRCLESLHDSGLVPAVVSGGSTPTLFQSHLVSGMNEIRPGTYIFNDRNTVASGACAWGDCAATLLVTVISNAKSGQVLIDGGSKTFSSDTMAGGSEAEFGRIVEAPQSRFFKMNEEHGFVDVSASGDAFAVGDRLRVIPNHICVAVNLHERMYGVRGERVECVWQVEARGKLQ
jgi:D-serine deaminase-like pyridoxal phosphate-dependent protein